MKNLLILLSLVLTIQSTVLAQTDLNYYLPKDENYDINIPTPQDVLGYQVGDWMVSHDLLIKYLETIAAKSDRAVLVEYARSYENRPLVHLIFSSPENLARLEELKAQHQLLNNPKTASQVNTNEMPLVVLLGYSIHGNEASGVNASLLTVYHLAAAQSKSVKDLLKNTIIVVDPALNPDGVNRFASWVNANKSYAALDDPNSRVFNEVYPGGRTNHYWFDLNRDYLLLASPESRGRVAWMQEWTPNIVTDHHEMGSNSTFFFQPGVPSRNNPLTPAKNYTLTKAIANFHAKRLDQIGSLYFSEENFDDYYFGKGSSYPDINAGIGILFEQASSRGFIRKTENGILTFPFTIRNQFTVTLSTLDAAASMRKELLDYQKEFYSSAYQQAQQDKVAGWIFGENNDLGKLSDFLQILNVHHINYEQISQDYKTKEHIFLKDFAYFVPATQKNYRLLKSIFGKSTTFADKTFYDVTTWNFFDAFDLPNAEITKKANQPLTTNSPIAIPTQGKLVGEGKAVAYAFRWDDYYAPRVLAAIQAKGLRTKVATNPFHYQYNNLNETFDYGTILIPAENQNLSKQQLDAFLSKLAKQTAVDIYKLETSLIPEGSDLGSNLFATLNKPEVLVFVEGGTSSRDAGEVWHLFDQRYNMPVSLVKQSMINRVNLNEYTTVVLAGGSYNELGKKGIEKLRQWVQNGGVLITYKLATAWATQNLSLDIQFKELVEIEPKGIPAYANRRSDANLQQINGAVFEVAFDKTHPLAFGIPGNSLPVFKTGTMVAQLPEDAYRSPFRYIAKPLKNGYCSVENQKRIANAPFVITSKMGRGTVISILDNTNFRGFWYGTNKVFANAVFFGQTI